MERFSFLAILASVGMATAVSAESPARFRWEVGQTLIYRVTQQTHVSDTADGQTVATQTKLNLTKRWQVSSIEDGVATLQMSLIALRMETRKPDGGTIVFDSAKPDPDQADLNQQMMQYVGPPIASLRMDASGRVVEVKESKFGPASRFTADLPFKVALPESMPQAGRSWERSYQIKLEPPQGAGEMFDAIQKYACTAANDGILTIAMATTVKNPPAAAADRIPLIPLTPTGVLQFDAANGRLKKAELKMEAELADHRGDGSKYTFRSTYVEEFVEK